MQSIIRWTLPHLAPPYSEALVLWIRVFSQYKKGSMEEIQYNKYILAPQYTYCIPAVPVKVWRCVHKGNSFFFSWYYCIPRCLLEN